MFVVKVIYKPISCLTSMNLFMCGQFIAFRKFIPISISTGECFGVLVQNEKPVSKHPVSLLEGFVQVNNMYIVSLMKATLCNTEMKHRKTVL